VGALRSRCVAVVRCSLRLRCLVYAFYWLPLVTFPFVRSLFFVFVGYRSLRFYYVRWFWKKKKKKKKNVGCLRLILLFVAVGAVQRRAFTDRHHGLPRCRLFPVPSSFAAGFVRCALPAVPHPSSCHLQIGTAPTAAALRPELRFGSRHRIVLWFKTMDGSTAAALRFSNALAGL